MSRLFLSYSRQDDEPFVKQLYLDLTDSRFQVWWDRVSMPSRALTFLHEIREAVNEADRVVVIIGPSAVRSDYVRAEWQYALIASKVVTPILRLGDYSLLPPELKNLHCIDFREAHASAGSFADLVRILNDPVPKLGPLNDDAQSPPPHFQPRPDAMTRLAETVLLDLKHPVVLTPNRRITVLHGIAGVGKSVLAAAFARATETRRAFSDGIIWLSLAEQPDLTRNLEEVGNALKAGEEYFADLAKGRKRLRELLAGKAVLIVLDNLTESPQAIPFVRALDDRGRLLITTRDSGLASSLEAQEQRLDVLNPEAALRHLADWANMTVDTLPSEAREVAQECGNLPFALALSGAMARDSVPWTDLLAKLRKFDLGYLEKWFPHYPYPNLLKSLEVSVDLLKQSDPGAARRYSELAVFAPGVAVPEPAVVMFWLHQDDRLDEPEARKLLARLASKSLLRLEGAAPHRLISLHDLQSDYLRAVAADLTALHVALIEAYRRKCSDVWSAGPADGYFFEHLPHHLAQAGHVEPLRRLLFDFDWLRAKLDATSASALVADYRLVSRDEDLCSTEEALRLGAHVLAVDKEQLGSQLIGRLLNSESPDIGSMLDQAFARDVAPWLCPFTPSLTPPGGPLVQILTGHTWQISAVALIPVKRKAISASGDFTLKIWDLDTGVELRTLRGHTSWVGAVAVTSDERLAISASFDRTLRLWDLETGIGVRTLSHRSPVSAVTVTPDRTIAISGSQDGALTLWDLENGQELRTWLGHQRQIEALAVTPDGLRIISGAYDGTITVWELATGEVVRTLKAHRHCVNAIIVTPDGSQAISVSENIQIWDLEGDSEPRTLEHPTGQILAIAPLPEEGRFLLGCWESTVRLWDMNAATDLEVLDGHSGAVTSVAVMPDGHRVISASEDATLRMWDLQKTTGSGLPINHEGEVNLIAVTPNGLQVISASADGDIKVWDVTKGVEEYRLKGHTSSITTLVVTPDSRYVLSASHDRTIRMWDLASGSHEYTIRHTDSVQALALEPEGYWAVSASRDATLKVWNVQMGYERQTLEGHTDFVNTVAVMPDGARILSGSGDHTLKLWDVDSGSELWTLRGHTEPVTDVVVLPDGLRAISASEDCTLKVWNLETGTELFTLRGHTDYINALAVVQRGRYAISASDRVLKVWDLESRTELRTFDAQEERIRAVAVMPSGLDLVLALNNGSLRMWRIDTGQVVAAFRADGELSSCAAAPDGTTIIAGEKTGRIHFLWLRGAA